MSTALHAARVTARSYALDLSLARVVAIAITALLMAALPWDRSGGYDDGVYLSLVLSLGFAHYAASFIYARRPMERLCKTPLATLALGALLVGTLTLYLLPKHQELALVAYFGLHHMCNEVYMSHRAAGTGFGASVRLRVAALALNGALYLAILSREPLVAAYLPIAVIGVLVLASGAVFGIALFRLRGMLTGRERASLLSIETLGLALAAVVVLLGAQIRFIDVVLYHFVLWALYPAFRIAFMQGAAALGRYALLNAAMLAIAMALSPVGIRSYSLYGSGFLEAFYFFSFLHIGASFAVSDQHPNWIIRLFRPAPAG